jgi:hypothetical protein
MIVLDAPWPLQNQLEARLNRLRLTAHSLASVYIMRLLILAVNEKCYVIYQTKRYMNSKEDYI